MRFGARARAQVDFFNSTTGTQGLNIAAWFTSVNATESCHSRSAPRIQLGRHLLQFQLLCHPRGAWMPTFPLPWSDLRLPQQRTHPRQQTTAPRPSPWPAPVTIAILSCSRPMTIDLVHRPHNLRTLHHVLVDVFLHQFHVIPVRVLTETDGHRPRGDFERDRLRSELNSLGFQLLDRVGKVIDR